MSSWGRCGLTLTFPHPFLATFIFLDFGRIFGQSVILRHSDSKWKHPRRIHMNSSKMSLYMLMLPFESSPWGPVSTSTQVRRTETNCCTCKSILGNFDAIFEFWYVPWMLGQIPLVNVLLDLFDAWKKSKIFYLLFFFENVKEIRVEWAM